MPERELTADIDIDFVTAKEPDYRSRFEQLVGSVECKYLIKRNVYKSLGRVIAVPIKDEKLLASAMYATSNANGEQVYSINRVPSSGHGWDPNVVNSLASFQLSNNEPPRPPGTIGMERRQTRGSVASNLGSMMDPMFNPQPIAPSPPNPMAATNEMFNMVEFRFATASILRFRVKRMSTPIG